MENGQPLPFDRQAASNYLKQIAASSSAIEDGGEVQRRDNPVAIAVDLGNGSGQGTAWGCDLSYDYIKINAEYTT